MEVLVFSAIPFTAVKAIANSPFGESLQRRMLDTKKSALRNSSQLKALAQEARNQRYTQANYAYPYLHFKFTAMYADSKIIHILHGIYIIVSSMANNKVVNSLLVLQDMSL